MNKTCVHTAEYDSTTKGDEALTQATAWVNLEDITPSGGTQTPKATYQMIPGQEVDSWLPALWEVGDWADGGRGVLGFSWGR